MVEVLGQADVAVVVPDHAVTGVHQGAHQRRRPGHQLHAQAHDEQNDRALNALAGAGVFHFDIDSVGFDFHRAHLGALRRKTRRAGVEAAPSKT